MKNSKFVARLAILVAAGMFGAVGPFALTAKEEIPVVRHGPYLPLLGVKS